MQRLSGLLAIAGLASLILAWWQQESLPPAASLDGQLHFEPEQEETRRAPFTTRVGGIDYRVEPLYTYELRGLVVSRHDTSSWLAYLHKQWNDKLNVADLCVIWGTNIVDDLYHEFDFSSGQFTCNFRTNSRQAFQAFDLEAISNNHLLTDDAALAAAIRGVRTGDQVRLRGYLARYSHNEGGGFSRGTSTVRGDTGNGACETVWVEEFEVIQRGNAGWRALKWLALLLCALGAAGWLLAPVRVRGA